MDNIRDIINGSQLPRFVNKRVSIVGKVRDIDPSGTFFHIIATDDVAVKINVNEPINSLVSGWVEACGISTGKAVNAEDFVIFSNQDFDSNAHNELCNFLYSVPNIWNTEDSSLLLNF